MALFNNLVKTHSVTTTNAVRYVYNATIKGSVQNRDGCHLKFFDISALYLS